MRILVINGPNLNMLGKREVDVYGNLSLKAINNIMIIKARKLGISISFFQSNSEAAIISALHKSIYKYSGMIINLGGYTHNSISIRDAILLINIPIIEVHISNIYSREFFRRKSIISDVVTGQIVGLGFKGYLLALDAICEFSK